MRAWSRAAALVMGLALAAGAAVAGNSGGYRGPKRNGIYPAEGLLKTWPDGGPKLLWTYEKLGPGWASATVVDDTVYCIGGAPTGNLFALDLQTGERKWKKPYGVEFTARFDGTRSTPTVSDGLVIFSSGKKDQRSIYCHDAATGEQIWHVDGNQRYGGKEQGWGYNESPLVHEDKVIFTLRAKDDVCPPVVAVDKRTGETVWKADPGPGDLSAGDSSVALVGEGEDAVLVDTLWRAVLGLHPDTGETLWRIKISEGTIITPAWNDGYLAVGQNGHDRVVVYRFRGRREPERLWRKKLNGVSQVVLLDGKLFGIGSVTREVETDEGKTKKKRLTAWVSYDAETGELLKAKPCMDSGSVVAADGMVYIVEGGEHHWKTPKMSLLRPTENGFEHVSTFTPVVGTKELWVSPTIAAGRLFIRHGRQLACYDLRPGSYPDR